MKKIFIQLALLLMSSMALYSQTIDVKWSEQFVYDNKLDGFFDDYVGTNSTNIYAKFSNLALRPKKQNQKVKLIAFDKISMKRMGEVELKGYNAKYDNLEYYKTITLDEVIYVLWQKEKGNTTEVYAQSFDVKLKKINNLSKVYEVGKGKNGEDAMLIVYNRALNNKILIVKEFAAGKGDENLKIEYKLINSDFTMASSRQVTLPVKLNKKRRGLFSGLKSDQGSCTYELGKDGFLYVQDMIKIADEDRKSLKKGEASVYPHLMQIDMENGALQEYHLKFMKKNTFNFSTLVTNKGVKLYGFFSDLDKDEKGRDTHGTFFITLDTKTLKPSDIKFSYFDKSFLDQLYAADKENQKKGRGLFKSKKAKASDDESIDDNYIIERVIQDGDDIVLFCSIMRNWSQTTCTSNGTGGGSTCTTRYYCTKSNVTAFKLNAAGDIKWARNLDRTITYSGWNIYDLNVIQDMDNYYVVYGSGYQMNAKKKNMRSSKSGKQMNDRLEYAVFSTKTGDFKKAEYQVNGFNTKKSEAKYVNPTNIDVYDNHMYTSCQRVKLKPTTFIACLCPPVFYFMLFSGNSKKGKGYLGTINPVN